MAAYDFAMSSGGGGGGGGGGAGGGGGGILAAGSECHTKVEFHVRCRELKKMDRFSDSDPFCVVYVNGVELGRTEVG